MGAAELRFYGDLNDFLPPEERQRPRRIVFSVAPAVKDAIESLGPPHPEVELIAANRRPVDFAYRVREGDRIAVYPRFRTLEIPSHLRLRPELPDPPRFILDTHLGRLAAYLRLLGFDTLYRNDAGDEELAAASAAEGRILLTRDVGLLKRGAVTFGYWLRATATLAQVRETAARYGLVRRAHPFHRCLRCNSLLEKAGEEAIARGAPAQVRGVFTEYRQCPSCGRVYWKGSHYRRMLALLEELGYQGQA